MHMNEQPEDAGQPRNNDQAEEGNPGKLWSEVTDLLAMNSLSFDNYVLCDEGTTTSAELTTKDILQTIQNECSDNGEDDAAADNEGATLSQPEDCDELVTAADMMDITWKACISLAKNAKATQFLHRNVDELESFALQSLCCTR
ncbi:hypothetical protein HPB51_019047 [Rhipicephalus microplus]|uniref:Uncharacterized protein n=1 Tax=Rhipicephalus microplus TaxID=6941 RepID=A0A9J6D6P8_RHIMP|nr:hypothetical protein HPB51_019047 [Rhipicephalus microplus]